MARTSFGERVGQLAEAHPHESAVILVSITGDERLLTWSDLDRLSNGAARVMSGRGAGSDSLVVVALPNCLDHFVATIGAWKLGAAVLPLDPMAGDSQVGRMLRLVDPAMIVSVEGQGERFVRAGDLTADDVDCSVLQVLGDLPRSLRTSGGSTGVPKVMTSMREWAFDPALVPTTLDRRCGERTGQVQLVPLGLHHWSFGNSYFGLFIDHTIIVMERFTPDLAVELLQRCSVNIVRLVPSQMRWMLQVPGLGHRDLSQLEMLQHSAAPCPPSVKRRWMDILGPERVLEIYGSQENLGGAVIRGDEWLRRPGSVGQARGCQIRIADDAGHAVEPGIVGEIYMRPDDTVSPSYFGRAPDLKSLGDGFFSVGDLGHVDRAGYLYLSDRRSDLIIVAGWNVSPIEVEAALLELPGVADAAAIGLPDEDLGQRLHVVLTATDMDDPPDRRELDRHCRLRLSPHKVPSSYEIVHELPRNTAGKLLRRVLVGQVAGLGRSVGPSAAAVATRTDTQEALMAIWADVLGVEEVGAEDDFFHLGGHSLLATQVVSKVRDVLGVEVPLRVMFESPTVGGLGRAVDEARGGGVGLGVVAGVRDGSEMASFGQQSLWFLDQLVPDNPFYNVPSAYRLRGCLDVVALERALCEVVGRHEVLRTSFVARDGCPYQRIAAPGSVGLVVEDLSGLGREEAEVEAGRRADAEGAGPFDLARGPLLRCRLLRVASEEHVLLITMHHIVSDGWSMMVLLDEISALYGAFCRGEPCRLPGLPVQYADFAVWQRRRLEGELLDGHLDHWEARLAGAPPALVLPADRSRPPTPSYRGASEVFVVPARVARGLRAVGGARGATLYMTLLAGFKVLLARACGTDDIVVGGTTAGRSRVELEGLIGFFVNTLALRTDLSGDPTFAEVVERVRAVAIDAYEHQDAPFDKVVERLRPPRDLSRNPVVQVAFELNEKRPAPDRLGGTVVFEELDDGGERVTARLDVELFVVEAGDGSLRANLVYASELFDRSTMAGLAVGFQRLLESAVTDPMQRISQLSAPLLVNPVEPRVTGRGPGGGRGGRVS